MLKKTVLVGLLGLTSQAQSQSFFLGMNDKQDNITNVSNSLYRSVKSRLAEVLRRGFDSTIFIVRDNESDVNLNSIEFIEQASSSWSTDSKVGSSVNVNLSAQYKTYELVLNFSVNHPRFGLLDYSYRMGPYHQHVNFVFKGNANASFKPSNVLSKVGLPAFASKFLDSIANVSLDQSGHYESYQVLFDEMISTDENQMMNAFKLDLFDNVALPLCHELTGLPSSNIATSQCLPAFEFNREHLKLKDAARIVLHGPYTAKLAMEGLLWNLNPADFHQSEAGTCVISGRISFRIPFAFDNHLDYTYNYTDEGLVEVAFSASDMNANERYVGQRLIADVLDYVSQFHAAELKKRCQEKLPVDDSLDEWEYPEYM